MSEKFSLGLVALGLGGSLLLAFPSKAISSTTEKSVEFLEPDLQVAEILYQDWKTKQYCSCVLYAKALTGYSRPVGWAKNWPINTGLPVIGGVIVTNDGLAGHVAVITAITGETLALKEANWLSCQKSTRQLNMTDSSIMGFWRP